MSERALRGHTAVVSHGASGIGLAIARRLAVEGADIVLLDADPDVGAVASRLRSDLGMPAMGARGDLTDPHFVSTAFRAAVEHLDFPDLVVVRDGSGADVVVEAFRARLDAAGKAGVCVMLTDSPGPDRQDGSVQHCTVGLADSDVPAAVVTCWLRARPSSSG